LNLRYESPFKSESESASSSSTNSIWTSSTAPANESIAETASTVPVDPTLLYTCMLCKHVCNQGSCSPTVLKQLNLAYTYFARAVLNPSSRRFPHVQSVGCSAPHLTSSRTCARVAISHLTPPQHVIHQMISVGVDAVMFRLCFMFPLTHSYWWLVEWQV